MNSKFLTHLTFSLFFVVMLNAQTAPTPTENVVNLKLIVKDLANNQEFNLHTEEDTYYGLPYTDFFFLIELDNQSDSYETNYFRLKCIFNQISNSSAFPGEILGATAPVIIPPVKKKKTFAYSSQGYVSEYPFLAEIDYTIKPAEYLVTLKLLKYRNQQDYLDGNGNFVIETIHTFHLITNHHPDPITTRSTLDTFKIKTYPNPTKDNIVIEHSNITNLSNSKTPLNLTIFNKEGNRIRSQKLVGTYTNNNGLQYRVHTSKLPKGIYFFEITKGKNTTVKKIIKE